MQVQVNSDNHIVGTLGLSDRVRQTVEHELRHVADAITRVEVHLNDVNSGKSGTDDKRCMMEARLRGLQPISVEHRADVLDLAIDGAASQLARAIKSVLDKLDTAQKRGAPDKRDLPAEPEVPGEETS